MQMDEGEGSAADDDGRVFVGLGSNVGHRMQHLCFGYHRLARHPDIMVTAVSSVYESEAHTIGAKRGPAFLNAVIELETSLRPLDLLDVCLDAERSAGRHRADAEPWAPRTLDMDLLIFDGVRMRERELTIPHPRLAERLFILRPLADLAPEFTIPEPFAASVGELLASCTDESWIRRFSETLGDDCDDLIF